MIQGFLENLEAWFVFKMMTLWSTMMLQHYVMATTTSQMATGKSLRVFAKEESITALTMLDVLAAGVLLAVSSASFSK